MASRDFFEHTGPPDSNDLGNRPKVEGPFNVVGNGLIKSADVKIPLAARRTRESTV